MACWRPSARSARAAAVTRLDNDLRSLVLDTYAKAVAAEYSLTLSGRQEEARSVVREWVLRLGGDAYKMLAVFAGLAAVWLEGVAWLGSGTAALHIGAAALAGVGTLSFAASRKATVQASGARAAQVSLKLDNSLHQLENDLKDILTKLHEARLRTVVVLEELDKIDDERGTQLDAVIRYFKNLFTQAPALFFFVTDKAYFDLIASAIKRARRQRSYAIEHIR